MAVPAWKVALLERKRAQADAAANSSAGAPEQAVDPALAALPDWKRDILERKRQAEQRDAEAAAARSGGLGLGGRRECPPISRLCIAARASMQCAGMWACPGWRILSCPRHMEAPAATTYPSHCRLPSPFPQLRPRTRAGSTIDTAPTGWRKADASAANVVQDPDTKQIS